MKAKSSLLEWLNTLATVAIAATAIVALVYTYRQVNISREQAQLQIA
jgi:hypothetical protein